MFSIFSRRRRAQPLLSEEALRELIGSVEGVELSARLPQLDGAIAVEVAPRLKPVAPLLKNRGACLVVEVGTLDGFSLKSRTEIVTLLSDTVDFALCRLPLIRREIPVVLKEAVRVLKPGAPLMLMDLHPFSRFVQEEHLRNPVVEGGLPPGFEKQFKLFGSVGLSLESIREVFFETAHRRFFGEKGTALFEDLRRSPFLILLSGRKGGG